MRAAYARDGFLVLDGFADVATCSALIARAEDLIAGYTPPARAPVFSGVGRSQADIAHFRHSSDRVSFFLEDDGRAVNKIGHALHDLDPVFMDFSRQPRLAALAVGLGLADALLLQSMYIVKAPQVGGEVTPHQDATYLYSEPVTATGFWLALHDADPGNGGLYAYAGQHLGGLRERYRARDGELVTEPLDPTPWPQAARIDLATPAGTLVVLHGLLPHGSDANRSNRPRHAYALHVVDGTSRLSPDNWLQRRPEMPLRGF
ncbi:MAG: phytanoyl-CoA dioxygenase family protein [Alphaproteobacteria bacterium]